MSEQDTCWRVKDWKVYPKINLIQNDQSEFSVKPRLMKLLEFFLLNQHEVVSKDAILDYVWEDRVVTENLLTKSISELRKLVEERFPGAMKIETIRNVGYRLQPSFDIYLANRAETRETAEKETQRRSPLFWGALWLSLLLLLLTVRFFTKKEANNSQVKVERISSLKGQELSPVISPDGKNIAFLWREKLSGRYQVFLRPLSENNPRKLTNSTASEYNPVWSPDNTNIIFMRQEDTGEFLLLKKSVIGDDEIVLADLSEFTIHRGLIWTKDNSRLIFSAKKTSEAPYALFAFDIQTETIEQLTHPDAQSFGDRHPSLTETSEQLAFIRIDDNKTNTLAGVNVKSTLCFLSVKNLEIKEITMIPDEVNDLMYHEKLQQHVCWVSSELTDNQLMAIDANGRTTMLHKTSGGMPGKGAMGKNNTLYFEFWNSNLTVNQYALKSQCELGDMAREYLNSTVWDWGLRFATAADNMAFLSYRSGYKEIWMAPSNEPEKARQLTEFENFTIKSISISPDGKQVVFLCDEKGSSVLYTIQSNGQNLQKISEAGVKYTTPEWSADGRSIFYGANTSGMWNIWKKELEDGGADSMVQKGGYAVLPSPYHAQELFYTSLNLDTIFRLNLENGLSEVLLLSEGLEASNWATTQKGIYFIAWKERKSYLQFYDFSEKTTTSISLLHNVLPSITSLAVDKNGDAVYVAQADELNADLMSLHVE